MSENNESISEQFIIGNRSTFLEHLRLNKEIRQLIESAEQEKDPINKARINIKLDRLRIEKMKLSDKIPEKDPEIRKANLADRQDTQENLAKNIKFLQDQGIKDENII